MVFTACGEDVKTDSLESPTSAFLLPNAERQNGIITGVPGPVRLPRPPSSLPEKSSVARLSSKPLSFSPAQPAVEPALQACCSPAEWDRPLDLKNGQRKSGGRGTNLAAHATNAKLEYQNPRHETVQYDYKDPEKGFPEDTTEQNRPSPTPHHPPLRIKHIHSGSTDIEDEDSTAENHAKWILVSSFGPNPPLQTLQANLHKRYT